MQVGLIGLGKMGLNLGKNLMDHKHEVVAFDFKYERSRRNERVRGNGYI